MSIAFVLVAEMINTAIEGAIDAATTSFDPMAKLAKDIAAGAVLIASVNAVAVGYLVFAGKAADKTARVLDKLRNAPAEITVVALVLTVIIVIANGRPVELTDGAKEFLIKKGSNVDFGARPLRRAIENHIEDPLAEDLLRGEFQGKDRILVDVVKEGRADAVAMADILHYRRATIGDIRRVAQAAGIDVRSYAPA